MCDFDLQDDTGVGTVCEGACVECGVEDVTEFLRIVAIAYGRWK